MHRLTLFVLLVTSCTLYAQEPLSVMSYNLRLNVASDGENAWPERRDFVLAQLQYHAPAVVGVQEALPEQIAFLRERFTTHNFLGEGRDGGDAGEYSAIFYDRRRLDVRQSGTFWLSPTPDRVSKGWDAALPRICTYGRFADRETGDEFFVFNTHFDHRGEEARRRSASLILTMMDSLNQDSLPVVLTGDLNQTPDSEVLRILGTRMADTYTEAEVVLGPNATFNGFNHEEPASRRIDYVLVSREPRMEIAKAAVLTDARAGRYPSDHFPVAATLHLRPRPHITAHRGASGYRLENTLAAFRTAVDQEADVIELDVFRIADGTIVVHHDSKTDRLTDARGEIESLDLEQLRRLTLTNGERIPTLAEALRVIDHRLKVNVELKGGNTAAGTHALIREFVQDHGYKLSDFQISSFRHDELRRMRELDENIVIAVLPHRDPLAAIPVAREVKARYINPYHGSLNTDNVRAMHEAGLLVNPWTVNDRSTMRRMYELGVDGMITNYPDRALEEWRNFRQ